MENNANLMDIPEPTFIMLNVKGKKTKRLFRKWGEIRVIKANGEVRVVRKGGYERVNKTQVERRKEEKKK